MHTLTDFDVIDPQLRQIERVNVYCVEAAALKLDRCIGMTDEQATALASGIVGQEVLIVRGVRPGLEGHLLAYWFTCSDGITAPVILVNPGHTLSRTEVLHEVAHLLTDADGVLRGHGRSWRTTFLGLLDAAQARRVAGGYDFYGLSHDAVLTTSE